MKVYAEQGKDDESINEYVLNINKKAMKLHRKECSCVGNMSNRHRSFITVSKESIPKEFSPCKICKP